jgi:argininosuccinate lyase
MSCAIGSTLACATTAADALITTKELPMSLASTQTQFTLAEARLSRPPAERLVQHYVVPGLEKERRRFDEFLHVDLAHTTMIAEQGIIGREAARALLIALRDLRQKGENALTIDPVNGSFLLQVESYLGLQVGENFSGQMHTGRSRIDQGATVRRLFERNRALLVFDALIELRNAILSLAANHSRTVMPGYTHMQQAQPWVFGHYLLSFSFRLEESFDRLAEAYARINRNPLGTVGLAGTSWPLDRQRTTQFLGFHDIIENSKLGREAYYAAELVAALSFIMSDLNDLATDLHIWSSTEFALVESDDAYCGTSSIFPQKKNPAGLEAIKAAAGEAVTWLATALATFRAEGTGDQAVRELPMAEDALASTRASLELLAGIVSTLLVHEDRMLASVEASWATASNLADAIVRETALPFREVHHVVARLVRICLSQNLSPAEASSALLSQAAIETIGRSIDLPHDFIAQALDPQAFVRTRTTVGSVAPVEVDRMLDRAGKGVDAHRAWLVAERERIRVGEAVLAEAMGRIIGDTP